MGYTNGIIPKMQDEINRLQAELATANAALIAQGQALAQARSVVNEIAEGVLFPQQKALYYVLQWDSAADETMQESEGEE